MGNFLSNEDDDNENENIEEVKVEKKRKRTKNKTLRRKVDVDDEYLNSSNNYNPFSNITFSANDGSTEDDQSAEEAPKPIYQKRKRKQSRKHVSFE
jgi:hypothetical protein